MTKQKIIAVVVGVIVVGGGLFYGGMKYGQANASATVAGAGAYARFQGGAGTTRVGRGALGAGGGITVGQVIAKDNTSVTIQLSTDAGGGSKIIFLSASTPVMKSVNGSTNDIVVGNNVMISGTANSDGSITATNVQIRPAQKASTTTTTGIN